MAPPLRGIVSMLAGPRGAHRIPPDPGSRGTAGDPGNDRPKRSRERGGQGNAPRPTTAANHRRRDVEARLIGLPPGPGPDWWTPCWERGVAADLPADVLFDELTAFRPDVRVLHGLAVPGTGTTIDHVLIGSGGVVVAGTERCGGKVRTDGVHLRVRGKDLSAVVDVALWRAEAVRSTLERLGLHGTPVHGVLHWEHVESLGDRPICLRGVPLLSAGATLALAATGLDLSPLKVQRVTDALAPGAHH